jgi:hypothetical protein
MKTIRLTLALCLAACLHAATTTTITDTVRDQFNSLYNGPLTISLSVNGSTSGSTPVLSVVRTLSIKSGVLGTALVPNDTMTPAGTYYVFAFGSGESKYCTVPTSGSAVTLAAICTNSTPASGSTFSVAPSQVNPGTNGYCLVTTAGVTAWGSCSGSAAAAAWGDITGTLSAQTDLNTALGLKLTKASNLSDLTSASTARTNLGLGTAAVSATGDFDAAGAATTAQAAAILLSAQRASNLSDLANAGTARTNLGLAAVAATGVYSDLTGKPTVPTVATTSSILKGDGAGNASAATSGIDYVVPAGNAATATALAANGANCSAGSYPLGVNASGASESCTVATTGTVTSIATTAPITGGTITATGTIACPTCTTSAASLTSNAVVIGGGSQAQSTISASTTTTHALFATAGAPAFRAIAAGDLTTPVRAGGFQVSFAGSDAAAGAVQYVTIPYACTITDWVITADAGTATVKLWRIADGGTAIPTVANTLSTSGFGLSTGTRVHSTTLTDLSSTAIAAYDTFGVNLFAMATGTKYNFTLGCQR